MTYDEALSFIHSRDCFGSNLGLLRIERLTQALGNPQNQLKYIHVGGTNGKGSTCTMLSEIMISQGYRTGLFTSPYVVDFCERMQIDGKMISHDELALLVSEVKPVVEALDAQGICATEFEVVTAIAFLYFARNNCNIVILEVGLGGRLDSTNVIDCPLASVITSISLDHTNILGSTVQEIAAEKCGIIKHGGVCVAYPQMDERALDVIRKAALEKGNKLFVGDFSQAKIEREDICGTHFEYRGMKLFVPLSGRYQVCNAINAIETALAVNEKGFAVDERSIIDGIANARIAARMEVISSSPLVLLDGGHNEGACEVLYDNLRENVGGRITAVIGFMKDKDYAPFFERLAPLFSRIIVTMSSNPRTESTENLAIYAKKYCSDVLACDDPNEAIDLAFSLLSEGESLVVCGSLYLASDVREKIFSKI